MIRCVRTTIRLDDDLLAAAKQRAGARGITLTKLVEDALRETLARRPASQAERPQLPTYGSGGLMPGVDLDDSASLLDAMSGR